MKVIWDATDMDPGRTVWRDAECLICGNPANGKSPRVLIVKKSGLIMTMGTAEEVAEYMTKYEYLAHDEKAVTRARRNSNDPRR